MGRHARMKRFKAVDPSNPHSHNEEKVYLKPRKDKNLFHSENMLSNINKTKRKKSKNKYKKQPGETDFRHIQRLNNEIQIEIVKADGQVQLEPEKDGLNKQSTRKQKQKQRLLAKKDKLKQRRRAKMFEKDEEMRWKDKVEFGEVVLEPPKLKSKPRKADSISKQNNKINSLLLTEKFTQTKNKNNISMARKQTLMNERERVIQAYRDLKKNKIISNNL